MHAQMFAKILNYLAHFLSSAMKIKFSTTRKCAKTPDDEKLHAKEGLRAPFGIGPKLSTTSEHRTDFEDDKLICCA